MPPKGKTGTKGQKQIVEDNKATLQFYWYIILATNVTYLGVTYWFFWEQFTFLCMVVFGVACAMVGGSYKMMASMAGAAYDERGGLIDGGIDLNFESGMAENLKDLILLTSIVEGLALISSYFWLFLLLAPGRAFYMLWVSVLSPWIFAEAPEVNEKKQKKMERKMKRAELRR